MKKAISITIGGIIFYIEEDGFEKLRDYLASISQYFASFEDNEEITSDIEGRIAELFLAKLTDGRQNLTLEDVNELIATMGTTADFEASMPDQDNPLDNEPKAEQSEAPPKDHFAESEFNGPKRLYRDTKRKIVAGVASGLAHYMNIDPLWIRLALAVLSINVTILSNHFAFMPFSITIIAYVVLWIIMPANDQLKENPKIKKLFRKPDDKVIGGVSGGIAAYFGTDIIPIRILFVIFAFIGGSGILAYIIIWIITPEAKSITEKMQMQGDPITLKNIEDNVKKSIKFKSGEENPFVKILLLPFRLIGALIQALSKILGPLFIFLISAFRIIFGAIIMLIGFSIMAGVIILSISAMTGYYFHDVSWVHLEPVEWFRASLDSWIISSFILTTIIPAIGFSLLGLAIILRRKVVSSMIGWSLFGLWLIGMVIGSVAIPNLIMQYTEENSITEESIFDYNTGQIRLEMRDEADFDFDNVDLKIKGHDSNEIKLVKIINSKGSSDKDAKENAREITYNVAQEGNTIVFDHEVLYNIEKYRFQTIDLLLYLPFDSAFTFDGDIDEILKNNISHYYETDIYNQTWAITKHQKMVCLSCPDDPYIDTADETADEPIPVLEETLTEDGFISKMTYPFEDFTEVSVASLFDVTIIQGDDNEFHVSVEGTDEQLDEVYLTMVGDELIVKYNPNDWKWWKEGLDHKVKLSIIAPSIDQINFSGACKGTINGFDEEELAIELDGASNLYVSGEINNLSAEIDGASQLELHGSGQNLDLRLSGASKIEARYFTADLVNVKADGASKVEVYGKAEIIIEAQGMSKVKYRGTSNVHSTIEGLSSVETF